MNALLLVAHGSRRKESNDEVKALAEKLRQNCNEQYPVIHSAFLELAEPLIPEGIKQCITDGAQSVIILPYFLNSGRHVIEDIPGIVNATRPLYPNINIRIAKHLGASDLMVELLVTSANTTN